MLRRPMASAQGPATSRWMAVGPTRCHLHLDRAPVRSSVIASMGFVLGSRQGASGQAAQYTLEWVERDEFACAVVMEMRGMNTPSRSTT